MLSEVNNENLQEENKKNYIMSLLLIQTKELKKLYEGEMEPSPNNFYLVDKKALDQYKQENGYENAIQIYNSLNDYSNYTDFKEKMALSYQ